MGGKTTLKASIRGACLGALALLALVLVPAAAGATTYYALGGGGNTKASCAQGDECNLAKAVKEAEKSGSGSAVVLVPGPSFTPGEVVTVDGSIEIGGTPGAPRPTIVGPSGEGALILINGAHLHDVNLTAGGGNYALDISEASAERVFVESTTTGTVACNFFIGSMSDSVCFARESSGVFMGGSTATYTAHLRNVDAIGKVDGILIFGPLSATYENLLEAVNTIAIGGPGYYDVGVNSGVGGARVLLTNSDYDTTNLYGGSKNLAITPVGTNGNLTAPPQFVDEAGGDFHQLPTSPTVDAGLTEGANGALDLDGNPRALTAHPTCASLAGPSDIGAYELVPPAPFCPTASSTGHSNVAPPPPSPPPPGTTLKRAKIDSDKGTATFAFAGSGAVSGFVCELVRPAPKGANPRRKKPKFAACGSPRTYRHLVPGHYTFKVEAEGAGGSDPTPALRKFRIRP
jgi:hypothetical protein